MITTLMPDFRAVGYDELVYDMTYVLDLLPKLAGRGTPKDITWLRRFARTVIVPTDTSATRLNTGGLGRYNVTLNANKNWRDQPCCG
jgi:hypothetical protein